MIRSMFGPFVVGVLFLLLGIFWLHDYVHLGFVDTGRGGLFVPVTGANAMLVLFLTALFGVLCLMDFGYIVACLIVFSKRGDFVSSRRNRTRGIAEPASATTVFAVMLGLSIVITLLLLFLIKLIV